LPQLPKQRAGHERRQPLPRQSPHCAHRRSGSPRCGIDESDPDFEELVTSECDALDRLRKILRAARWVEGQAKALKEIEAEMRERRARFDAKTDTLRSIVKTALVSLDMKKLEAPDFSITISPGKPKVVITDESRDSDATLTKVVRSPTRTRSRKLWRLVRSFPELSLVSRLPS
jgi:hypothetical protein